MRPGQIFRVEQERRRLACPEFKNLVDHTIRGAVETLSCVGCDMGRGDDVAHRQQRVSWVWGFGVERHRVILLTGAFHVTTGIPLQAQDEEHQTRCNQTVELFKKTDPHLDKISMTPLGYAVFPSVGKGRFIVGGAAGTGCLYQGGAIIGQAKLAQVTLGLQLGGQSYAEVIFFQNDDAHRAFKGNNFEMSAQVSAVAASSGASANAKYRLGVLVFTIAKTGLMYEASVGGQKFSFKPLAKEDAEARRKEEGVRGTG